MDPSNLQHVSDEWLGRTRAIYEKAMMNIPAEHLSSAAADARQAHFNAICDEQRRRARSSE